MLKIGWSSKNISMEGPVAITGQMYQRISKGILDPNTLTCLVLGDETEVSILVSADLTSIKDGIIHEIRSAVKEKNDEIPTEKILMSATHTHTSPRYMRHAGYDKAPKQGVEFLEPEEYRTFLVKQTADAIVEAYENRQTGSFSYGFGYAVVSNHRRVVYFDDVTKRPNKKSEPSSLWGDKYAVMYGKTNDAMFSGYEGPVDSMVNFLFTFDATGELTGAIINVPCPSQNSEHESLLSADYWAETRKMIREKYGDIFILPQCACAGDMSPRPLHYREAEERKYALKYEGYQMPNVKKETEIYRRNEIAERILNAFDEVYAWATKEKIFDAKVVHRVKTLEMKRWKPSKEQFEAAYSEYEKYKQEPFVCTGDAMADYRENTYRSSVLSRYERVISRYEDEEDYSPVEMHVIQIGNIAFCSNPFELFVNYQHRIQARSPFVQTFVVQLAASIDSDNGYLCTPAAAENAGYGANLYSCDILPEAGIQLVEETLEELNRIKER